MKLCSTFRGWVLVVLLQHWASMSSLPSCLSVLPKSQPCCSGTGSALRLACTVVFKPFSFTSSLSSFVPLALRYQCWYSTAGALLARKWLMLNFRPCSQKHLFHRLYQLQHNILNSISQGVLLAGPSPLWTLWRIQSIVFILSLKKNGNFVF